MEHPCELLPYVKAQVTDACARMRVKCECEDVGRHTIFRFSNEPLNLKSFFLLHWKTVEQICDVDVLIDNICKYARQCTLFIN